MIRPAAVVFDMDGVLVHSGPVHYAAYHAVLGKRGHDLTPDAYRRLFGRSREQVFRALLGDIPDDDLRELMAAKHHAVIEALQTMHLEPIDGALAFARAARDAGLQIAVATSSRTPGLFLRAIGADALFPVIVDRTMVDRPKPDPGAYLTAAALLGVDPARCVVIEDSPLGLRAARAAGAYAVGLTTTHPAEHLADADRIADGFHELTDLLPA